MLKVNHLSKQYKSFKLDDINFEVKKGSINGFIGRNGAGKTTTLKAIMDLITYEGDITLFDKHMKDDEINIKQDIAFSLCDIDYYLDKTIKQLTNVTSRFYNQWNQDTFNKLCNSFNLDVNKKLNELSSGMKVKYQLAIALSHNAKLLILDEPTSGLDPISRDEVISLFEQFVSNKERSILFSTHITSDLDKCADTITYINNGKIRFFGPKKEFINKYLLVLTNKELDQSLLDKTVGSSIHANGSLYLIESNNKELFNGFNLTVPTIEQIMICLERKDNEISSL